MKHAASYRHPPLKRHASLQPLSRDHYVGLVQAQHLQRAADGHAGQRRAALADFCSAWETDIAGHFADEETLLPPLMEPEARDRLVREHALLRALAAEPRARLAWADPASDWMRRLSETLRDHIRWEERLAFPAIEQADPVMLKILEEQTQIIERTRPRIHGNRQPMAEFGFRKMPRPVRSRAPGALDQP